MDVGRVIKGLETCIKYINQECPIGCPYYEICTKDEERDVFHPVLRDAIALLKEREWNLLKEDTDGIIRGLPGDDGQYLMTDGKDIWIDIYVDGVSDGIILDSGRDVREIKAWMELPKLPNGQAVKLWE